MCANYETVEVELASFPQLKIRLPADRREIWATNFGAMICWSYEKGEPEQHQGRFGLLPHFAKEVTFGRHTYNARSETVGEKPSFRSAWRRRHTALIPCTRFFEPCYETGRAVRHAIWLADQDVMTIGGIWSDWTNPATGETERSFSMLTVNADDHPLMRRMHKPGDEKRMPVIIAEADREKWLSGDDKAISALVRQYSSAEMTDRAEPLKKHGA